MEPAEPQKGKKEKIESLEKELFDLRQGLCTVQDYYRDLDAIAQRQDAEENVDQSLLKPLIAEDEEFEGIWKFHDEMLIHDPSSSVSGPGMYEAFLAYCARKGRSAADKSSFEFMLIQMGLRQAPTGGRWRGYRLRNGSR
jgi:hypothetical protein